MVICLEAGGQSAWAERILRSLGHDVVVANAARVRLIAEATLKNDTVDAETLARLVRVDRQLLCPIAHRSAETQRRRAVLRSRRTLVNARTSCMNTARGILRSFGHRTLGRSPERLAESLTSADIPEELVEDPHRFRRSRDVAGYLGLRPKMRESGQTSRFGGITHQGDTEMRTLLVQAAHGLLRSRSDSDLKRWAVGTVARVGKKKAVVALARKLAVVMHAMWTKGEAFRPFREGLEVAA